MSLEIKDVEGNKNQGRVLELARTRDVGEAMNVAKTRAARARITARRATRNRKDHRAGRQVDGAAGSDSSSCRSDEREREKHAKRRRGNGPRLSGPRRGLDGRIYMQTVRIEQVRYKQKK